MHSIILTLQVDKFEPAQLADVLSAYANMVHHPGALIEPLNEKLLPKLDSMDAGELQIHAVMQLCMCFNVLQVKHGARLFLMNIVSIAANSVSH